MKNNNELDRTKEVLLSDDFSNQNQFMNLFYNDLKNLLSDYFQFDSAIKISFEKGKDNYLLNISLNTFGVKKFISIPK